MSRWLPPLWIALLAGFPLRFSHADPTPRGAGQIGKMGEIATSPADSLLPPRATFPIWTGLTASDVELPMRAPHIAPRPAVPIPPSPLVPQEAFIEEEILDLEPVPEDAEVTFFFPVDLFVESMGSWPTALDRMKFAAQEAGSAFTAALHGELRAPLVGGDLVAEGPPVVVPTSGAAARMGVLVAVGGMNAATGSTGESPAAELVGANRAGARSPVSPVRASAVALLGELQLRIPGVAPAAPLMIASAGRGLGEEDRHVAGEPGEEDRHVAGGASGQVANQRPGELDSTGPANTHPASDARSIASSDGTGVSLMDPVRRVEVITGRVEAGRRVVPESLGVGAPMVAEYLRVTPRSPGVATLVGTAVPPTEIPGGASVEAGTAVQAASAPGPGTSEATSASPTAGPLGRAVERVASAGGDRDGIKVPVPLVPAEGSGATTVSAPEGITAQTASAPEREATGPVMATSVAGPLGRPSEQVASGGGDRDGITELSGPVPGPAAAGPLGRPLEQVAAAASDRDGITPGAGATVTDRPPATAAVGVAPAAPTTPAGMERPAAQVATATSPELPREGASKPATASASVPPASVVPPSAAPAPAASRPARPPRGVEPAPRRIAANSTRPGPVRASGESRSGPPPGAGQALVREMLEDGYPQARQRRREMRRVDRWPWMRRVRRTDDRRG